VTGASNRGADPVPLPDPAPGAPPPDPAATRFLRDDPEVVEIETAGAAAGLVVLSDAHAPGWRAFVDGAPTDILSADYVGRAVPVPAGRSVVRFEYTHPLLDRGLLISLTTAGLLVLGFGGGRRVAPAPPHRTRKRRLTTGESVPPRRAGHSMALDDALDASCPRSVSHELEQDHSAHRHQHGRR
jgi:hypothetical protein